MYVISTYWKFVCVYNIMSVLRAKKKALKFTKEKNRNYPKKLRKINEKSLKKKSFIL